MLESFYRNGVLAHPRISLLCLFLIIAFLGFQATKLEIDASAETLVLKGDKDLAFARKIGERYASAESLVIAYSPKTDLLSDDSLATLRSLSESLTALPAIESVTSILNVPLLQSPPKPIRELLGDIPTLESKGVDKTLAREEFLSSPIYRENLVSTDFTTTALLLNLKPNPEFNALLKKRNAFRDKESLGTLSQAEATEFAHVRREFKALRDETRAANHETITEIRMIMDGYQREGELFLGGVNMIADDVIGFIKNDLQTYGLMVLLLLILVLWVVFGQIRFILLPVMIAGMSVLATTGILGMFGWEVTVISSNFISLQLIVTMSLAIHLTVRYRELLKNNPDASQKELLLQTSMAMAKPCFFVIATTVAGFGSLISSGILPVINFGWMMSAGVSVSLLITFLVFPAAMMLSVKTPFNGVFIEKLAFPEKLARFVNQNHRFILLAGVLTLVFGLSGASRLIVENSFIDYFNKDTEIYQGMKKIDRELGGTTPLDIIVDFPEEKTPEPAQVTPDGDDFFSDFEDEFQAQQDDSAYWFTPNKTETINAVHAYLETVPAIGKVLSFSTLLQTGKILNEGEELDSFMIALFYKELPEEYKTMILTPYVSIDHNQVRFSTRIVDSQEGLRRNALMQDIRQGLETEVGLNPDHFRLSGMMVMYNNMLQRLFESQIMTLGIVVLVLSGMFLILFRSLTLTFISMISNIIPVFTIFGVMGWGGIPLDMMTITIAAISLGIAVDNAIHYIYRFRNEVAKDHDYTEAMYRTNSTIGYAMYYTSLSIVIGFSVLTISNFTPTIYFGLLTVIAMLMSLLGNLMLLPRLLMLFKPFK